MVKSISCRRAIGEILQMLVDDEQIEADFKYFIDGLLSDYFYRKKLDYSLTTLEYREHWIEKKTADSLIEIMKEISHSKD